MNELGFPTRESVYGVKLKMIQHGMSFGRREFQNPCNSIDDAFHLWGVCGGGSRVSGGDSKGLLHCAAIRWAASSIWLDSGAFLGAPKQSWQAGPIYLMQPLLQLNRSISNKPRFTKGCLPIVSFQWGHPVEKG